MAFYSHLPGLPRKVKWPVWEIEDHDNSDTTITAVYCKESDAIFHVKTAQLEKFPDSKLYARGLELLKKKADTLQHFKADVQWIAEEEKFHAEHAEKSPRKKRKLLVYKKQKTGRENDDPKELHDSKDTNEESIDKHEYKSAGDSNRETNRRNRKRTNIGELNSDSSAPNNKRKQRQNISKRHNDIEKDSVEGTNEEISDQSGKNAGDIQNKKYTNGRKNLKRTNIGMLDKIYSGAPNKKRKQRQNKRKVCLQNDTGNDSGENEEISDQIARDMQNDIGKDSVEGENEEISDQNAKDIQNDIGKDSVEGENVVISDQSDINAGEIKSKQDTNRRKKLQGTNMGVIDNIPDVDIGKHSVESEVISDQSAIDIQSDIEKDSDQNAQDIQNNIGKDSVEGENVVILDQSDINAGEFKSKRDTNRRKKLPRTNMGVLDNIHDVGIGKHSVEVESEVISDQSAIDIQSDIEKDSGEVENEEISDQSAIDIQSDIEKDSGEVENEEISDQSAIDIQSDIEKDSGEVENEEISDQYAKDIQNNIGKDSVEGENVVISEQSAMDIQSDIEEDSGEVENEEISDQNARDPWNDTGEDIHNNEYFEYPDSDNDPEFVPQNETESSSDESCYDNEIKKYKSEKKLERMNIEKTKAGGNQDEYIQSESDEPCSPLISVCNESDAEGDGNEAFDLTQKLAMHLHTVVSDDEEEEEKDECEKIPDIMNKRIYLTKVTKSKTSKYGRPKKTEREYTSTSVCPFSCNKRIHTNFSHHLNSKKHENEDEVKKLKEMDGKQRKRAIELLRLRGNHQENLKVLQRKFGHIRVLRRKENAENEVSETEYFDIREYGPCPCCLGWIKKKNLKRHGKTCKSKDDMLNNSITFLEVQSDILSGRITTSACSMLVNEVFTIMKTDKITKIAKKDDLIVNLGNQWIKRNIGNKVMRKYYTSSVMRLASRLLIELQKLSGMEMSLMEFLKPAYFEKFVIASLKVARQDDDDVEDIEAPSNAIKLGYDIKRLSSAKYAFGMTSGNTVMKKEGKEFLAVMNIRWHIEVTRLAREVLAEKSLNKVTALPLPEDVRTLAEHMKTELSNFDVSNKTHTNFRRAATLSLARLTLFNRRRCHEVQATRLETFEKRKTGVDAISVEMMRKLTDWEKKLLETQELLQVRGKGRKPVPVIIPGDVVKVLKFLGDRDIRREVGIQVENKFLFASSGMGVVRAYDAIKKMTNQAKLKMPNLIRTTKMRKYMATMVQCLDTTEAERQWIVTHLGHTMNVHLTHYQQVSDILERVDVAKILLIQDTNQVAKFVGRKPRDVDLEDIMSVEQEDNGVQDEDAYGNPEVQEEDVDGNPEDFIPDIYDFCEPFEGNDEPPSKKNKTKPVVRHRWSQEEEAELRVLFAGNLEKLKCPNSREIERAIKVSAKKKGKINRLKPDNIKKKMSNMIIKLRKQN